MKRGSNGLQPNQQGQAAYRNGYDAAEKGLGEAANHYLRVPAHRGGLGLSAWWSAGFADAKDGKARRW